MKLISALLIGITSTAANAVTPQISLDELRALQLNKAVMELVDVRMPADFAKGHIQGARNVTQGEIGTGVWDPEKQAVVYCEVLFMEKPDFYLASTESKRFEQPRRCKLLQRLRSENRDDLLLIQIEPPLIGQDFGLGTNDIDLVVVATRHSGESLFPITHWPVYVHVARVLADDIKERDSLQDKELQPISWAELYETEENARLKKM